MKVCVGLSGGVDSSVAALLLKRQGYDVFAMFMQNWHDADATLHGDCEWEEDRFVAELVARKIGIPFYFIDLSEEYRKRVVDYMFDEYAKGRTPNPDVLCNREIKFDAFLSAAGKLGADMVATGHYCRKGEAGEGATVTGVSFLSAAGKLGADMVATGHYCRKGEAGEGAAVTGVSFLSAAGKLGADMVATGHYCRKGEAGEGAAVTGVSSDGAMVGRFGSGAVAGGFGDGAGLGAAGGRPIYRLLAGADPKKDQSYFLCQLSQEQLARAMFPLGDMLKTEVRAMAKEADLPSAEKKDSQGICFVGKVDLPTFLQQKIRSEAGDIVEVYDAYYAENGQYDFIRRTLASLLPEGAELNMTTDYISEDKCTAVSIPAVAFLPDRIAELPDETLFRLSRPMEYSIRFEIETYRSGKHHVKKTRYKENPLGRIIGRHDGAQFYTIGQRKGLNVGGHKDSLFVISTDVERNIIYVGEGHRHKGLSRSCIAIAVGEIHWLRPDLSMAPGEIRRYSVRIRYRQPLQAATLVMRASALYILFDAPQRGITAGQFAVWYDGDELLGSGPISG